MRVTTRLPAILRHSINLYPRAYRVRWGPELLLTLEDEYLNRIESGSNPTAVMILLAFDIAYNAVIQHYEKGETMTKNNQPPKVKIPSSKMLVTTATVLYVVGLIIILIFENNSWQTAYFNEIVAKFLTSIVLGLASLLASIPILRYISANKKTKEATKAITIFGAVLLAICLVTVFSNWAFVPVGAATIFFLIAAAVFHSKLRYSLALVASVTLNLTLVSLVAIAAITVFSPAKSPSADYVTNLTFRQCYDWALNDDRFYDEKTGITTIPREEIPAGCSTSLSMLEMIYTSKRGTDSDPLRSDNHDTTNFQLDISPSTFDDASTKNTD